MDKITVIQILRIAAVIALLCIAAAIATPKGRLPLALRGLARVLRQTPNSPTPVPDSRPSALRRLLAFFLVILAIMVAIAIPPV